MRDPISKDTDATMPPKARRWRRWQWSAADRSRQGDDNMGNLVVLLLSLGLLACAGIAFAIYYWGWPLAAPTGG